MRSPLRLIAAITAVCALPLVVVGTFVTASSSAPRQRPAGDARFAPLPTSPTTTTTLPTIIVVPVTPAPTIPTIPPVLVAPTGPDDETTAPPVETAAPPVETAPPVATIAPAPPQPVATVAPGVATFGGAPASSMTVAALAPHAGEQVVLGELSGDPAQWSDEVLGFLAAEHIDPAVHSGPVAPGVPGALVSNEGCAVQCITSGVAYAVGTGAHLRVTTSTPASIRITVFGDTSATSPTPATQWGHTWPHLHHGTIYTALVRAEDAGGNVAFASGSFQTLNRYARIDLDSVGIDPHPPYDHPHLVWWIDGAQQPAAEGGLFFLPLALWTPGTTVGEVVELRFQALLHDHQSDCSPFDSSCNAGYYGEVVAATFELDTYPDDAVWWTSHELEAVLTPPCVPPTLCDQPTPLAYSAAVRVSVWYDA